MELSLVFKGSRDYVQGPDIFDGLVHALADRENTYIESLAFKKFASRVCAVSNIEPRYCYVARGRLRTADGSHNQFWVLETDRPIERRVEFKESLISDAAEINGHVIEGSVRTDFSIMEQFVALTKALNYELVPYPHGRWIVAEIRMSHPMPKTYSSQTLRVEQIANTANRFTRNKLFIDEISFGELRFIVSSS